MNRWREAVLLGAPGVLLGIVGTTHPMHLTPSTAHQWFVIHVGGLFVFPLVGVAVAWLVWGRRDLLALGVVAASYVFAVCYTALDVVSGVGNGYVTDRLGAAAVPRPDAVTLAFHIGSRLGDVGAWALFVAGVLLGVDAVRRHGGRSAPPILLLLVGSWLLRTDHIMLPWGAPACVAIGVGTGWLAFLSRSSAPVVARATTPALDP